MKDRVLIKHDIAANWAKAVNFVPLAGELIIYDGIVENGQYLESPKMKIGDGQHKLADLPFINIDGSSKDVTIQGYSYEDDTETLEIKL